jgi:peptidyl-prolyl cis-trans isomerase A (cyclophilin A)
MDRPRDGQTKSDALHSAIVFHRVIDGAHGPCAATTGRAWAAPYTFEDECPPDGPTFNQVGRLAMANAGPGTNGSQFFVTVAETPWLNGRHTIFGHVTEGYDVVEAMSKVATSGQDKPADEIVIERIDIVE